MAEKFLKWGKSRLKDLNKSTSKIDEESSQDDDQQEVDLEVHREMAEEVEHLRATLEAQTEMYATNISILRSALEDQEKASETQELRKEIEEMKRRLKLKQKYSVDEKRMERIAKEQQQELLEKLEQHVRSNEIRAEEANEMMRRFKAEKEELHFREVNTLREKCTKTQETICLLERTYREEKEQFETEVKLVQEHRENEESSAREEASICEEMILSRRRFRRDLNSKNEQLEGTEKEVSRLKKELKETNEIIEDLQVQSQSRRKKLDAMKRELKRVSSTSSGGSSSKSFKHDKNNDVERARHRLESFYTSNDPTNKKNINTLLRKFESSSRVDMLMQIVESKYISSSTLSQERVKKNGVENNRSTPSPAQRENDELVVWGLKQQMIDNEKLFSDELHAISIQQSMLRDRHRQDILRLKNQHEIMLQKRLTSAKQEHAEAMRNAKIETELQITRVKLNIRDEMREQSKESFIVKQRSSNSDATKQEEKTMKKSISPPSTPPRTPDPILIVENVLSSDRERSRRSLRAKERAAKRRLMRDNERNACREAAGDGGGSDAFDD